LDSASGVFHGRPTACAPMRSVSFAKRVMRAALLPMPLLILPGCATTTASVGTDAVACSAFEPIRWSTRSGKQRSITRRGLRSVAQNIGLARSRWRHFDLRPGAKDGLSLSQ
jgi:hypothetical protein